ncbi:MAG: hypothetical protein QIT35_gp31 [Methanophagales virus PBV299]|uniref:Prohead serine protease domain-containing protein n=1 Tax=Methanophagales virus PBV299 TaxID=2987730 RepID=A0ABY6GN26_9CAUD|nr:MAG: hypothetical protein QIT35_gp31 [Methanophagales virus PBV299]UYL64827.1 MAG: hypothetical protein OFDIEDLO_00031 [Methanophagales virus PBV299]
MNSSYLPVPSGGKETGRKFKLEDVLECFSKPALVRELIYLVGGTVIRGEGNDVDLVIRGRDLPPTLMEAILFRLFRGFSAYFNISYDETPKYLHITINNEGPYTDYVPLYSLALVPRSPAQVFKMSCGTQILAKSDKKLIIGGYAATPRIDLTNERISRKALESIFKSFKETPKEFRNLMWEHSSTQIGIILDEYEEKETKLDENGWYIIGELRRDIPLVRALSQKIVQQPEEFGFSVKIGVPHEEIKHVCMEDTCFTEIEDAYFIEVSVTANPANPSTKPIQTF